MAEPEKSGVHLTGEDSGWPVASEVEPGTVKDGTGEDDEGLEPAGAVVDNQILSESEAPEPGGPEAPEAPPPEEE